MKRVVPLVILTLACSLALPLSRAHAAPSGFAFLEVPAGARASALGGAYASLANDVDAAFWNPAGLSGVHGIQLSASHYEFFEKLRHDQFAIAGHLFGGGLSGSVRALYSEPIDERDDVGNLIGSFGAHDLDFGLHYGRSLSRAAAFGVSGEVIRERIANVSAMTYAIGFGGSLEPATWPGLRLAASAQHLGPAATYTIDGTPGERVDLPAAIQTGGSYAAAVGHTMTLRGALEGRFTRGRAGVGMAGLELSSGAGASLRLGMRANDSASSFSAGAGYALQALRLDYAFVPYRLDLGDTHRFSLSAQF